MIADLKNRMRLVLDSVASNSYYRKKYGIEKLDHEASKKYILDNFEKLPYMSKEEIPELQKAALNEIIGSRVIFSGGTSGFTGFMENTVEELKRIIPVFRIPLEMCGVKEGSTFISTCSTTASGYGVLIDYVAMDMNAVLLQCNDAQSYNFKTIEAFSKKRKIDVIFGTPMGVLGLTHDDELMKCLKDVKVLFVGGSPMDPQIESALKKSFGCKIIDYIGMTEIGGIGYRFSVSDPFTYDHNTAIIEIDKETGCAVLTSLIYDHMPMMRFKTDDLAQLTDDDRYLLKGRANVTFYIGGTKVPMDLFHKICKLLDVSDMFQLTLKKDGTATVLTLNIVDEEREYDHKKVEEFILAENLALYNKIEKKLVKFDIKFIRSEELIGVTNRGKFKRLIEL